MSATMKALRIDQMSVEERLSLVDEIWDSIVADQPLPSLPDSQQQDLQRRLAARDAAPQAGSSWEEVKARLEAQL